MFYSDRMWRFILITQLIVTSSSPSCAGKHLPTLSSCFRSCDNFEIFRETCRDSYPPRWSFHCIISRSSIKTREGSACCSLEMVLISSNIWCIFLSVLVFAINLFLLWRFQHGMRLRRHQCFGCELSPQWYLWCGVMVFVEVVVVICLWFIFGGARFKLKGSFWGLS